MTYLGTFGADFTTPGTSAEIELQLVLNYTQDIAGNYSDVAWVFQMVEYVNANPFNLTPSNVGNAIIEGSVFSASNLTYDFRGSLATVVIASGTRRIYHAANGTAEDITIAAAYNGFSPIGTASFSTTFDLPAIPRASTPTFSDSTPDAGDSITITTNRADGSFTHDIEYRWKGSGSAYTSIATGVGASTGWTVPATLINDIPNAESRVLEIRTTTKSGATTVGQTSVDLTVGVPASVLPDFGTVTNSEATTTPNVASLIGAYVQGWTKLALAITSAVAGTGATVTSKVVQVRSGSTVLQTVNVTAGAADSAVVTASGTVTLRGIVTDSRGRTHSEDVSVTFLAYGLPTVTSIGVQRALSDGTPDEEGTYLRVNLNAAVQSLLVSAVQKNALTYRISTSPRDANTWTVKATTTPGGITFNSHAEVGTYSITDAFDVKIEVYDKLSSVAPLAIIATISVAGVFLHLGNAGEGIGVGKYWEQGSVDALERIYQRDGKQVIDEDDLAAALLAADKIWVVTNLAALDALTDAKVGDLAWMTTPGTGITPLYWEAYAGSGAGLDWRPNGDVVASSATNLNNFIAAVVLISDTTFKLGGRAIVTAASGGRYERFFTSTAGAMTPPRFYGFGRTIRRRAAANLATNASVTTITTGTSVQDSGDFTYSAGVLTCVTAGTYKITAVIDFAGSATGARAIGLQFSGSALTVYQQFATVSSLALTMTLVTYATLAAGDTVTPVAQQNSGGNLSVTAGLELEQIA